MRIQFTDLSRRLIESPYEIPIAMLGFLYGLLRVVEHDITPGSIEAALPGWLTWMWTISVLLGGAATLLGKFSGWPRTETAGQVGIAYGFALYGLSDIAAYGWSGVFPAVIYLMVAAAAVMRVRVLSTAIRQPRVPKKRGR